MKEAQLHFRTIRQLTARQILARCILAVRPANVARSGLHRILNGNFGLFEGLHHCDSMTPPAHFTFLNRSEELMHGAIWSCESREALWNYNLHYFDDLNAVSANKRRKPHRALIEQWVQENPPLKGIGWDAYPTTLRIVNWIKWAARGNSMEPEWLQSLALQARWLRKRLEYHLLANHLLANAKALVFAGVFFEGEEARGWLNRGLSILAKELPEQILSDGGHFERSPMYHSVVLEDVLDLVNLFSGAGQLGLEVANNVRSYKRVVPVARAAGVRMLRWLQGMCHPDGRIAFFNDAAFGIAAERRALFEYADRLGIEVPPQFEDGLTHFADSGYIRFQRGPLVALLDVAPVGPDYQPGHAHADTLSFELSLFGQRVFVNSGTSTYEDGEERHRQRGTLAHNTVAIDGENSSEVWKSFRVARRAYPRDLRVEETTGAARVSCEHDGYTRLWGRPVHRREWRFKEGELTIRDEVFSSSRVPGFSRSRTKFAPTGKSNAVASFHLHPDVVIEPAEGAGSFRLFPRDGDVATFTCEGGAAVLEDGTWHPEFGLSIPNKVIRCYFEGSRLESRLTWPAE